MEGQEEGIGAADSEPLTMSGVDFPRLFEAHYASYEEDLPFWLSLAASRPGPILELGCGPGRVLASLAQAGHEIDGLDLSPQMLARAERRIAAHPRNRVRVIQGDLYRLALERRYGLILVPCNTFAYLDETSAQEALVRIRRHLLPGGLFAAELPSAQEALSVSLDSDEPIEAFLEPETGNPVQVYASQEEEPEQSRVRVVWRYDELHPDGTVTRTEVRTTVQLWSPQRLGEAARAAGFSSFETFGDYDRSPFTLASPRLLLLAHA
jgi:SAM-dependent methyltransferase